MRISVLTFLAALLCFLAPVQGQIKRSRAESIPELTASNTVGYGDVWLQSALSVISRKQSGAFFEPYQAIGLGLSQNLSLWGGAVPFEGGIKHVIGKADAHIKVTWPNNDNLRLFGFGAQGDLVLSTEMDTSRPFRSRSISTGRSSTTIASSRATGSRASGSASNTRTGATADSWRSNTASTSP